MAKTTSVPPKAPVKPASVASKPASVVSSAPVASTKKRKPTQDEIAKRAYEIYLKRNGIHGDDLADWVQAEKELSEGK